MKRRLKLWTAYMLIFCLSMAVMLPASKSVRADDTGELIIEDFNIFLNGTTPLDKNVEVRDGDKLSVSFRWRLPDSDKTHSVFSTTIENYHHLKFIDKQSIDLRLSGNVVGRLTIDVDESNGNVIVSADFTEEYLKKTERNGGAIVEAYADINKGKDEDGKEKEMSVRMWYHFPFTYRVSGDGSSLWVWKSAQGKAYKDDSGNYKQEFYVSLRTNGGAVTDVKLFDAPGSAITVPSKVRIDKSNMSGITEGSEMTLDELQAKLHSMPKDAQVGFTYVADVNRGVYSQSADGSADYRNVFRAEYKNSEALQKTAESSAYVNVYRPYVQKSGEIVKDAAGNATGKIKWSVRIDLNDLAGETISIDDIDDNMLDKASDYKLVPREEYGKIVGYDLTYETEIPAADMGDRLREHKYPNDVKVSVAGYPYAAHGEAVLPAESWIHKEVIDYDQGSKILSWKITLKNIPADITGVSVDEWVDNGGWHEFIYDSFRIQVGDGDIEQIEEISDWSNRPPVYRNGRKIELTDAYISSVTNKTLTIYVDTLVRDDTVDGKVYANIASLNYTPDGGENTKIEARAEWQKKTAIYKSGAADDTSTAVNYSVDIYLGKIDGFKAGTPIIIKDKMPEGLEFDENSCRVIGKKIQDDWWRPEDSGLTEASSVRVTANGSDILFEIPVTDAMLERINRIKAEDGKESMLSLCYTARIKDVKKYITDGKEVSYTNTAAAEYGGKQIGDSTNITKLTPKQMIKKDWWYNSIKAPYMQYEIKINPDRFDLSDDRIIVTDRMGESLIYCLDTIKVYRYEGYDLVPLVNGTDYSYVYSQENNTIEFSLPDSQSLVISYDAYVNAYIDDKIVNNGDLTEDNAFNDVSIAGYKNEQSRSKVYYSGKAITPRGWAQNNTTGEIKLLKIYKSQKGTVMLPDCEFRLVEYGLIGEDLVETRTVKAGIVTDKNGSAQLKEMQSGKIYGLVETSVPEGGFSVKKQPLYFILGDSAKYPAPAGYNVLYVNEGGTVIFENDPPKEEPSESEDESDTSKPQEDTSKEEPSESVEETKTGGSEKETPTKKGDVEGEGDTSSETPSKSEEGSSSETPSNPEKETQDSQGGNKEPEGETDPDNDRNGDLEGDGSLVGTSDHAYIKTILLALIFGVLAVAITEITILWSKSEE